MVSRLFINHFHVLSLYILYWQKKGFCPTFFLLLADEEDVVVVAVFAVVLWWSAGRDSGTGCRVGVLMLRLLVPEAEAVVAATPPVTPGLADITPWHTGEYGSEITYLSL